MTKQLGRILAVTFLAVITLLSVPTVTHAAPTHVPATAPSAQECAGRSGREYHWWGYSDYLNACETQFIIDAYATAGAAGEGCQVIPNPYVALVCQTLTTLYSEAEPYIRDAFNRSGGVGVYVNYLHNGIPIALNPQ